MIPGGWWPQFATYTETCPGTWRSYYHTEETSTTRREAFYYETDIRLFTDSLTLYASVQFLSCWGANTRSRTLLFSYEDTPHQGRPGQTAASTFITRRNEVLVHTPRLLWREVEMFGNWTQHNLSTPSALGKQRRESHGNWPYKISPDDKTCGGWLRGGGRGSLWTHLLRPTQIWPGKRVNKVM